MEFTVRLAPQAEGGFTAQCVELPGAISQGETADEALENVRDAIKMIIDHRREEFRKMPVEGAAAKFRMVEVDA